MTGNDEWLRHWLASGSTRPDAKYPTREDLLKFRQLRDAGGVSAFRAAACDMCKAEIPTGFLFCSRACAVKSEVHGGK